MIPIHLIHQPFPREIGRNLGVLPKLPPVKCWFRACLWRSSRLWGDLKGGKDIIQWLINLLINSCSLDKCWMTSNCPKSAAKCSKFLPEVSNKALTSKSCPFEGYFEIRNCNQFSPLLKWFPWLFPSLHSSRTKSNRQTCSILFAKSSCKKSDIYFTALEVRREKRKAREIQNLIWPKLSTWIWTFLSPDFWHISSWNFFPVKGRS